MKKKALSSLLWISVAIVLIDLGYVLYFLVIHNNLQNLFQITTQLFPDPFLPFYIRIPIFIVTVLMLFFLYRNRQNLKNEIRLRQQIESENLEQGKSLEKSLALSKATLEATADGILVVDENRRIAGHNQKFAQMWGIPSSVLVSGNDKEAVNFVLNQLKDPQGFVNSLERLYNSEPWAEYLDELEFKDGKFFERYTKPQVQGGEIIGRVFSFRDVTKRKEMEKQLIYQATHDSLTMLPNRVILLDRINQAIKEETRAKIMAAVLFFDLDRFKLINDSLGHNLGDAVLQRVSKRLSECIRESDTVARWGGDEFVILLRNLKREEDVIPIVEKCLEMLEKEFSIGRYKLSVTSSVGVAFFPKDGKNAEDLLKNADSAMYYAKSNGHNTYKFYTPKMNARTKYLLELSNELHFSLQKNQLELYYQPIVDLKEGNVVGAEALLRWNHPKKGMISPKEFIPIAEDTGLILPIGEWVLRRACVEAKKWQNSIMSDFCISVNLSSQQFKQREILRILKSILEETELNPNRLDLELTESIIMENAQVYLDLMKSMKDIGVGLVIDDFGTGYSSLSYLKMFPVDKIKIDKSFIQDISREEEGEAIVRAILAMAKELRLKVIAEGIEQHIQLDFLKMQVCEFGQGYFFSRPLPKSEFEKLLIQNIKHPHSLL